jgi:predicted amidohydrolase YtcJ
VRIRKDGSLAGDGIRTTGLIKEFPDNIKLNELFPNQPVILTRIDGHAAIANKTALDLAGLKPGQKISGGEVETINGKLSGILVDNAQVLFTPKFRNKLKRRSRSRF